MGSKTTQVSRADPYKPAQPMINQGVTDAQALYNRPNPAQTGPTATDRMGGFDKYGGGFRIDPYAGNMVAGMTNAQQQANSMVQQAVPQQLANIAGAQGTIAGLQRQGYANGFQGAVNNSMHAGTTGQFNQGLNGAMDTGLSQGYQSAANANMNTGVDPALSAAVNYSQDRSNSGQFNQGVAGAQNTSFDPRLTQGINAAQNTAFDSGFNAITGQPRGNDSRFNSVINRETNPNNSLQMTNNMRRNVIEGIAPNIQNTFGRSGMANSSLFAQNLAKGLGAGLAPVEYQIAADNRQRAMTAAGMAQNAFESGKNFDFATGQARQGALDAGRNRSLQAGSVAQNFTDAGRNRALAAGQAAQGALERSRAASLAAGQVSNSAQEAYLNRLMQTGTTTQGFTDAATNRAMAAGTASQNDYMNRLNMATNAAQMGQDAMNTNENQAMAAAGMVPAMNAAYYDPIRALDKVGTRQQRQAQNEINAKMLRDQQAKGAEMKAIQDYLALTGGVGSQFGTQTGTRTHQPGLLEVAGTAMKAIPFL